MLPTRKESRLASRWREFLIEGFRSSGIAANGSNCIGATWGQTSCKRLEYGQWLDLEDSAPSPVTLYPCAPLLDGARDGLHGPCGRRPGTDQFAISRLLPSCRFADGSTVRVGDMPASASVRRRPIAGAQRRRDRLLVARSRRTAKSLSTVVRWRFDRQRSFVCVSPLCDMSVDSYMKPSCYALGAALALAVTTAPANLLVPQNSLLYVL